MTVATVELTHHEVKALVDRLEPHLPPDISVVRPTKIKLGKDNSKVQIWYDKFVSDSNEPDEYYLSCKQQAKPSLYEAVEALAKPLIEICEAEDAWDVEDITVTGVSFSWSNDIMGAVITAQKRLEYSPQPLNINTPHKTVEPYSDGGDPEHCLSQKAVIALDRLLIEIQAYIDGDRAQLSLLEDEA